MSVIEFDPLDWLVSTTRALGSYVTTTLNDPDVKVEMSFPNTRDWLKEMPLDKVLVHFEQDDVSDPILGFGIPGVEVLDDDDPLNPTWQLEEAAQHVVNYDVGVWVSAEMGGATKRMQVVQALKNMFTTARGKTALNDVTRGLWVVSFDGGRNELDRINDIPVWRAMDMTLLVRVFSRHVPAAPEVVPLDITQGENLTIVGEDGMDDPVVTP